MDWRYYKSHNRSGTDYMINYIDDEDKRFSTGRFDMIIIDDYGIIGLSQKAA